MGRVRIDAINLRKRAYKVVERSILEHQDNDVFDLTEPASPSAATALFFFSVCDFLDVAKMLAPTGQGEDESELSCSCRRWREETDQSADCG